MAHLNIAHVGRLESASFDLDKAFTVLCGPNNSGKTYAATVLYGLYEALYAPLHLFSQETLQAFIETEKPLPVLPLCSEHATTFYENLAGVLKQSLPELFGTAGDHFSKSRIDLSANNDTAGMKRRRCHLTFPGCARSSALDPAFQEDSGELTLKWRNDQDRSRHLGEVEHLVEGLLKDYLVGFRRPFFFPAERNAVNLFARDILLNRNEYLNRSLIQRESGHTRPRAYAKPIQDNIRFMETIGKARNYQECSFADLAATLESKALQGRVQLSTERDLQFFTEDGVTLDPGMTSSLVKSLSGLVFYFRHLAEKRDILFIDEPEANLHPNVQRVLTRVLVEAANRGIKVVISTHSDIMLQELNNLVMLSVGSKAAKSLCDKYQVERNELLKPYQLGVYVLDETAHAVEIEEHGFDVASISNVVDHLASAAQDIFYTLFE